MHIIESLFSSVSLSGEQTLCLKYNKNKLHKTDCLCLQTRSVDRLLTRIYDSFINQTGLKTTQYGLLRCINNFHSPCMSDIAGALCLDQTTASRNIGKLQQGGYVQTCPAEDDPRKTMLELTPLRHEKLIEGRAAWEKAQNLVKDQFGEKDFEQLFVLLDRNTEILDEN